MSDGEKLGLFLVIVGLGLIVGKASAKLGRETGVPTLGISMRCQHRRTRAGWVAVGQPPWQNGAKGFFRRRPGGGDEISGPSLSVVSLRKSGSAAARPLAHLWQAADLFRNKVSNQKDQ